MRVLLAHDDIATTRNLIVALKAAKIIVDHTGLGEEAFQLISTYEYDAVLLGAEFSDIGGLGMLRQMRSAQKAVPVLMLVPKELAFLTIKAFDSGADDVMVTSVDSAELIARIHAIVRRSAGSADPVIRAGKLYIKLKNREIFYADQRLDLTGKEFAILELLILRHGMVLTKDAFLNHLYGGIDEPEMKIIDIFICKLRKKLKAVGAPEIVVTVWGRGYMLREERVELVITSTMPEPITIPTRDSEIAALIENLGRSETRSTG